VTGQKKRMNALWTDAPLIRLSKSAKIGERIETPFKLESNLNKDVIRLMDRSIAT
jgi:hypothetical protein